MKKILLWLLLFPLTLFVGCRSNEPNAKGTVSAAAGVALLPSARAGSSVAAAGAVPPLTASIPASSWKRPLLFRVKSKGKSGFVFGTIHLPDPRLDTFPPPLESAMRDSDVVLTEIPMDDATQTAIAPTLTLPAGQSLAGAVPGPLYQRVQRAFLQQGIPFEPFERMKPWAVSVQLAVLDRLMSLALNKPIDARIYQRAQEQGKQTRALETATEQLSIFDGLKRAEQVELLRLTLEYRDTAQRDKRDVLEELLEAYLSGDEEALERLIREAYDSKSALSLKLMKRVLLDRNASMAQRIVTHIEANPSKSQFFAVGCGHVVGNDGIVARLKRRNFEVVRVEP